MTIPKTNILRQNESGSDVDAAKQKTDGQGYRNLI